MFNNLLTNQIQSFISNPANQHMIQQLAQNNPQLLQQLSPQQTLQPLNQVQQQAQVNPLDAINSKLIEYDNKFNEYTSAINALTNELNLVKAANEELEKRFPKVESPVTKP